MSLKHEKSFYPTRTEEERQKDKRETFTVSVNDEERQILNSCKSILEQSKDSTALKQMAMVGAKVLHDEKTKVLLGLVFKNKRNNERLGIIDFE